MVNALTYVFFSRMFICDTESNYKLAANHRGNHVILSSEIDSGQEFTVNNV